MKNLRTSLACLALLASVAACSDANSLTAPGAPRFDGGGFQGSGNYTGSGSETDPEPEPAPTDRSPFVGSGS